MIMVSLGDGTLYQIDSIDPQQAKAVVEYKLRQRSDIRSVQSVKRIFGAVMSPDSKTYNSGDEQDGKPLVCVRGWSYKH